MRRLYASAVAGAILSGLGLAGTGDAAPVAPSFERGVPAVATAEDFGFGDLAALGPRPLLTILLEYSDWRFSARHTPEYYRDVLFATSEGRLVGSAAGEGSVFDEISDGRFWYENAGVLGPFEHPDDPATDADESTYRCAYGFTAACRASGQQQRTKAIEAAAASGFDFARYDTNDDGCISAWELTILLVFAEQGGVRVGAQTDGPIRRVPVGGDKSVCVRAVGAGESVSAATISHELLHTLGLVDVYGGRSSYNAPYTLMGPTITATEDDAFEYHLDPYNKLRLGWVRPEILNITDTGCHLLRAAELTPTDLPKSYLVYDPNRGPNEYFMLEHRLPVAFNYDGDPWLRGSFSVPDQGLAIWYVKTGADNELLRVPNLEGAAGLDRALYIIPRLSVIPGRPPGFGGLWNELSNAARPLWLDLDGTTSGTESGLVVRVKSPARRAEIVFRLGEEDALCAEIPPVQGPPPGTLPTIDDPPCALVGRSVTCTLETPAFTAVRRMPQAVRPGKRFRVTWSVTAREPTKGEVRIEDALPKDFRPVSKLGVFTLTRRRTQKRSYRVRPPRRLGRHSLPAVVELRLPPDAEPERFTLDGAVNLFSPRMLEGHEVRPDGEPDLAPKPDLVVVAVSANGALVRNQGKGRAAPFAVRFAASGTETASVDGLDAGATIAVLIPLGVCTKPAEPLTVTSDPDGAVPESDESNNSGAGVC